MNFNINKSNEMNINQNDSFSDDDLGLGMLTDNNYKNNENKNDLDNFSETSNNNNLGNTQNYQNNFMNRQEDEKSNFSGNSDVSSYVGSDLTPEEEDKKKVMLLSKLKRLQKRGYTISRAYNINSSLEDIQAEVETIKREANLEQGTKVAKNMLISVCSLLEFANNKFDPMDIVLDGWSEEINLDVENGEYDEVMEELYDKYYDKVQMSPEMKLILMVGGSAVKFHISHTLLKQMVPGGDALLRQNPGLSDDIMNLVNKTEQGAKLQNEMNNIHKGNVSGLSNMKGPEDVDDILAELENETNNAISNNHKMGNKDTGIIDITF